MFRRWSVHPAGWGIGSAAGMVVLVLSVTAIAGIGSAAPARSATARPAAVRSAACSRGAPGAIGPESWGPARHMLAPEGAQAIRLCRYSGLNAHPALSLVSFRVLTRHSRVAELVRRFDGLPRPPRGAVACPADDGSQILAMLAYPHGQEVKISVGETGCNDVTNGTVRRTASGYGPHPKRGPRLLAQLERLLSGSHPRSAAAHSHAG